MLETSTGINSGKIFENFAFSFVIRNLLRFALQSACLCKRFHLKNLCLLWRLPSRFFLFSFTVLEKFVYICAEKRFCYTASTKLKRKPIRDEKMKWSSLFHSAAAVVVVVVWFFIRMHFRWEPDDGEWSAQ